MSETRNKKCRDKHSTRHRCRHGGLCAPVHKKEKGACVRLDWLHCLHAQQSLSDACVLLTHAP